MFRTDLRTETKNERFCLDTGFFKGKTVFTESGFRNIGCAVLFFKKSRAKGLKKFVASVSENKIIRLQSMVFGTKFFKFLGMRAWVPGKVVDIFDDA